MQYPTLHALYPKHSPNGWTVISYVGLCALLLWPIWSGTRLAGMLTVDMADTLYFQRAFFQHWFDHQSVNSNVQTDGIWLWLPNWLDHLTMMPFRVFPFPWSANLWWLCVWSSGGLMTHWVAQKMGASTQHAFLCGVSWLLSESILRELNLFHAPQSMTLFLPLFLLALIRWTTKPSNTNALYLGVIFGVNALIYWYNALFLSILIIPAAITTRHRSLIWILCSIILMCGYPLWDYLSLHSPLISHSLSEEIQRNSQWLVADRSHRVSLVLGLACLVHCLRSKKDWQWFTLLTVTVLLSTGGMLWTTLQGLHPFLERLHWPERWTVLVPLLMIPMLIQIKKPFIWLALSLIETGLFSPNLPIVTTDLAPYQCLAQLSDIDGMLIEVGHLNPKQGPWIALHQQFHNADVPGPIGIPPQHRSKDQWNGWPEAQKWEQLFSGISDWENDSFEQLNAQGIAAILLMPPPLSALSQAEYNRYRLQLSTHIGPAEELGCGHLWWTGETQFPLHSDSSPSPTPTVQKTIIERLDAF
ncbi:MAG: hypothetical protein ACON4U_05270 [Myxococcota bacterium]